MIWFRRVVGYAFFLLGFFLFTPYAFASCTISTSPSSGSYAQTQNNFSITFNLTSTTALQGQMSIKSSQDSGGYLVIYPDSINTPSGCTTSNSNNNTISFSCPTDATSWQITGHAVLNNEVSHTLTFSNATNFDTCTSTFSFIPPDPDGQITTSPASSNESVGVPFSVDVGISGTEFNAASATVIVSPNLTINSISNSHQTCDFSYTTTPTMFDPSFAGTLSDTSSGCIAYTFILTPTSAGTGHITFLNAQVLAARDGSNILTGVQNGSFTIIGPTSTPTPTPIPGAPTSTPTLTSAPGAAATATPVPTPTPIPDTTPPVILLTTNFSKVYKDTPALVGQATDASGIAKLEYSFDKGDTWTNATNFTKNALSVNFSIQPQNLPDGTYSVVMRAHDAAGNSATTTPVQTLVIDRIPPTIVVTTNFTNVYKNTPAITGQASDVRGVDRIDYSLDGGKSWLPVDSFTRDALSVNFSVQPPNLDDGNYSVVIRAADSVGNVGNASVGTLIIDRIPPIIGGNLLSVGPQVLTGQSGVSLGVVGVKEKITLSARGGPTTMHILATTSKTKLPQIITLMKDQDTGLWSGVLDFQNPGFYHLSIIAIDGAKHIVTKDLQSLLIQNSGQVFSEDKIAIPGAKITLYYQDPYAKEWVVWDGAPYAEQNPQLDFDKTGYAYFLPAGTYYLKAQAIGYQDAQSNIFSLSKPTPLTTDITLKRNTGFQFGPLFISFLDFATDSITIAPSVTTPDSLITSPLVGQASPEFSLPSTNGNTFDLLSTQGKPSVITFVSTWSPPALDQLSYLDTLGDISHVVINEQEKLSPSTVFVKRGGYTFPFVTDEDGVLIEKYNVQSYPTHYFLDRAGIIRDIYVGVLTDGEIRGKLSAIGEK